MAPLTCECDRINVQLPSLICDPTIAKDPKRTPAKVSLADLEELQRKFLSNHVINGHNLRKISLYPGQHVSANKTHVPWEEGNRKRERKRAQKAYFLDLWLSPLFLSGALWEEIRCTAKVVDGYNAIGSTRTHVAARSSRSTSLFPIMRTFLRRNLGNCYRSSQPSTREGHPKSTETQSLYHHHHHHHLCVSQSENSRLNVTQFEPTTLQKSEEKIGKSEEQLPAVAAKGHKNDVPRSF
jgi:hypothetical protein